MFVLASNQFWKCFSVNADVWLRMENGFSGKEFQLTVKLRPLTQKIFSAKILPSNHFWRHAKRERERKMTHTCKQRERERDREPKKPKIVAPPASRTANPRTRVVTPRTHKLVIDLVLVLVWNFCNKICLWFWFFNFSLWSLILLLLLWWCGWWCFDGFLVVWWWVLCG